MPPRETKLRITGDSRGAVSSLDQFNRGILSTSRGLRQFRGLLAGIGAMTAIRVMSDIGNRLVSSGDALRLVAAQAGLSNDEIAEFGRRMGELRVRAQELGFSSDDVTAALLGVGMKAVHLRGDLSKVDAIMEILGHSMLVAKGQNLSFEKSAEDVTRVLEAYGFTAADADRVTDQLTQIFLETTRTLPELAGGLVELGSSARALAGDFGQTPSDIFRDILVILGELGPEAADAVEAIFKVVEAAGEGDQKARELLQRIGIVLNEDGGGAPPLLGVFNDLHVALGEGARSASTLKELFGDFISEKDAQRIADVVLNLQELTRLKGAVDGSAGAAEALVGRATERPSGGDRFRAFHQAVRRTLGLAENKTPSELWRELRSEPLIAGMPTVAVQEMVAALVAGGSLTAVEAKEWWSRMMGGVQGMAHGGVVHGPTPVVLGDNASGREMALPLERTGDFAAMIAAHLGGAGGGGGIVISGPVNLPNVRSARDFVRDLRRMEFEAQYGKLGARKGGG